jgi:hypothetical protein
MMHERDVAALLRAATEQVAVPPPPADDLVRRGAARVRRRRVGAVTAVAAGVAAVAAGLPLALGAGQSPGTPAADSSPSGAGQPACVSRLPATTLPVWARAGFSDPAPRAAHVLGRRGDIVAILFAQPLTSPAAADHTNKILWVARPAGDTSGATASEPPSTELRIDARLLDGSATAVRRVPGGPGPSIVDLPRPGCWHLTLHWSGRTDSLDLWYAAG